MPDVNQHDTREFTIPELMRDIHAINRSKGFWDTERNIGEMLMLVVSECSEALECDRKVQYFSGNGYTQTDKNLALESDFEDDFKKWFGARVKDTFEDEIADAVIRLLDIAAGLNIDLAWHIAAKLKYNKTRPHRHGKQY